MGWFQNWDPKKLWSITIFVIEMAIWVTLTLS